MDFDQIREVIEPYAELESPSFIHGMLIGLICVDNDIQEAVWIKKLIEEAQIKSVKEAFLKNLHELYLATDKGLNGSGFELELCLPDDKESIAFRASMIGQLCEGVLYGIGLAGGLSEMESKLSEEVREIVNDLGEIARIDVTDLKADEVDPDQIENDLTQLMEFIKVGVLMLNEELNPTQAPPIMETEEDHVATVH
ncbi:UPF0149 family protein [Thiomicrorhabdus indica]|uniref:UPF0149 family protein n=1 Tax=Thiomicrorhabdus indica TaxID=2267253 RepID=UPI00102DAF58|nr:UPF0149 family protein [Thiomicrorhabdus indica]